MTFEIEKMVLVGLFISKPRSVETEIVPETTRFQKKPSNFKQYHLVRA